ncbi:hypothetical protein EVG20_g5519 [Dentipellis fragilis]|uniref:Uncharacterized protein n=1 Tax=Dentipellis fragilis TaxID=205917 RepID=A0A4Y9YV40_9AGAM|nr:hypothetical protein EVG20_g5519 [Dentipellis fragilis]
MVIVTADPQYVHDITEIKRIPTSNLGGPSEAKRSWSCDIGTYQKTGAHGRADTAGRYLYGVVYTIHPDMKKVHGPPRFLLPLHNNMSDLIIYGFFALLLLSLLYARSIGRRELGLPPGPPTLPILGNIHQFLKRYPHLKHTGSRDGRDNMAGSSRWMLSLLTSIYRADTPVTQLKVSSQTIVVVSDRRIARDLLETKGASTSSRPPSHFGELVTGSRNMVLMQYCPSPVSLWIMQADLESFSLLAQDLRRVRRLAHNMLSKDACDRHLPIQSAEATQLMYDFLKQPDGFYDHVTRYTSSVITSVLAGVRSPRITSPIVVGFNKFIHKWTGLMEPTAHPPVDVFPILKYVPERWASWKTIARNVRTLQRQLYFGLIESCERRVAADQQNGSFLEDFVANSDKYGIDRETAAYLCGILLEGGTETTATYLLHFVLLMVNHPEVQSKAQHEVDEIIGEDRAPTLEDFESLPYVHAVMSEVFRMRPPLQMGFPHYTIADEVVDNYLVPKNSTIIVNIWAMNHDPEVFDHPERFDPDRFMMPELRSKAGMKDTGDDSDWDLPFGYGRRSCVGIHLAKSSLKLNVMNFLWAFDFKHAIDPASKKPIPADINGYMQGATLTPLPFVCDIQPRSVARAKIIERNFVDARSIYEPFEKELSPEDLAPSPLLTKLPGCPRSSMSVRGNTRQGSRPRINAPACSPAGLPKPTFLSTMQTHASPTYKPQVAIVTGAAHGIGLAIAQRLADDGISVALNDLPSYDGALAEAVAGIEKKGVKAIVLAGDVTSEEQVAAMVQTTVEKLGRLDVMVANAGIAIVDSILTITAADFRKTLAVNLEGVLFCYKHAAIQMMKQGDGGRIIGASSVLGKKGNENLLAYSTSKFAVRGMTQSAAFELAPHGITVNAYAPGVVDTTLAELKPGAGTAMMKIPFATSVPKESIANWVAYIASSQSSFVNGQTMIIDGGIQVD